MISWKCRLTGLLTIALYYIIKLKQMKTQKLKVLILTKDRIDYDGNTIGLDNSAQFLATALSANGYSAKNVKVVDGNSVNKEIFDYKPQIVVLEALWVSPTKLKELTKLYPKIGFVIRIHSNIPFLAMEGTALQQIKELAGITGVVVSCNNEKTTKELGEVLNLSLEYLPNLYLKPSYTPTKTKSPADNDSVLDISCFGAIRPLKNQLIQAMAAVLAAEKLNKRLNFHINSTRVEQKGDPILRNIKELFSDSTHKLIEHNWESHPKFLKTLTKMDLGMQVSFSESYNIVTADHVHVGIPVVVSDEIDWLSVDTMATTTDLLEISQKIISVLKVKEAHIVNNTANLALANKQGLKTWKEFLNKY